MSEPAVKLTTYFSERDREGHQFVADALFDVYERHRMRTSVLLRGSEGFGHRSRLTDRLLTLSESLPLASIAVDEWARVEQALPEVVKLVHHGLITLERARLLTGRELEQPAARLGSTVTELDSGAIKLTVYGGRSVRAAGRPGYVEAIDVLKRAGALAAVTLLAVDGTLVGERRRARFFARNENVPLMLLAICEEATVANLIAHIAPLLDDPVATIERVQVCKIGGHVLAQPSLVPELDAGGSPIWQKLTVHVQEQARCGLHPLYRELIRRIHAEGGAGATALRGVRGFYGDRRPFSERMLSLHRNVPVVVVIVDAPTNVRKLWPIVDELTAEEGIVTSELVPTSRGLRRAGEPVRLELATTRLSR